MWCQILLWRVNAVSVPYPVHCDVNDVLNARGANKKRKKKVQIQVELLPSGVHVPLHTSRPAKLKMSVEGTNERQRSPTPGRASSPLVYRLLHVAATGEVPSVMASTQSSSSSKLEPSSPSTSSSSSLSSTSSSSSTVALLFCAGWGWAGG